MTNNALIIFTRNPELGKCKTRLAATIGGQAALEVYTFLVKHTVNITAALPIDCYVYYSNEIAQDDLWNKERFNKCLQVGDDLGQKMQHAFQEVFNLGYSQVGIIGTDLYDLSTEDIIQGFSLLEERDVVLGPAQDGGYYFLAMTELIPELFSNMEWSTDAVAKTTLNRLKEKHVAQLEIKNDIDVYSDIKEREAFSSFLKHLKIHD